MAELSHILIFPISCQQGMAGTRRVRSLMDNLPGRAALSFSNLIVANPGTTPAPTDYLADGYTCRELSYTYHNVLSWFRFWWQSGAFIRRQRVRQGGNLLYAYTDPDLFLLPIILFARSIGYLIVFDIVEDNSFVQDEGRSRLGMIRQKTGTFLTNYIHFFTDGLVVLSQHLYQKFLSISIQVPLLLAPVTLDFDRLPGRATYDPTAKQVIFYGGSFGQKDGLPLLLRAIQQVIKTYPDCLLRLTGQGSERDMAAFWQVVDELDLHDQIDYLGFVTVERYYLVLQTSDVLCMVRTNSSFANAGFPFKLCEMLGTGNLVIATAVSDVPHFLTNHLNALVIEPDNLTELTQALLWALHHPEARKVIGQQGYAVALREFNAQTVGERLELFLHQLQ